MNRIRIATIASSLTLSIYFFIAGIAAMFVGPSTIVTTLLAPVSLLEDLFGPAFDGSAFGRDLLAAVSMWLTFICLIDLSLLLSSIDIRNSVRSFTTNSYTKRLLPRLRVI
jgi:hypothetical protein